MISGDLLAAAGSLGAASLYEATGGGSLPSRIAPLNPSMRLCGRALALTAPGDNLLLHHAITAASPGDVLVVDGGGRREVALWGELMTRAAITRRLSGLILDGCIRDAAAIVRLGFPVFAAGTALRGAPKQIGSRADLSAGARIGDVAVATGDLVLADRDGVVIVPAPRVEAAIERAIARERRESEMFEQIAAGSSTTEVLGLRELE
jgi:4-hydroxy-4-methyl-2-oxoglutarate aldolase